MPDREIELRSAFAVLVAAATTIFAFGSHAFSGTANLRNIGGTMALGAILSPVSAAMAGRWQGGI